MPLVDRPPGPLLRLALRVPTLLYRLHLGWLLGRRFLCLTHVGRRTGRRRRTVLEVIGCDPASGEVVVASGWGERAQWYRNLEAAPAAEVQLGRRRWRAPRQRFLDEPERVEALARYAGEHPRAARELARVFGAAGTGDAEIAGLAARLRAVAFRPR